jgi:hypothetical protein
VAKKVILGRTAESIRGDKTVWAWFGVNDKKDEWRITISLA